MKVFLYLSDFIVPLMIFGIICYGITMKIPVYDTFVKGAKDGFLTVIKIMPTMVGLMVAVGVLRASGFLEFLAQMIGKVTQYIGFRRIFTRYSEVNIWNSICSFLWRFTRRAASRIRFWG